jgi:hypothetical protein
VTDLVVMLAGQSNATMMAQRQVAGMTPYTGTYVWEPNTVWRPIASSDGAGMIEMANMLKTQTGRDVYVIVAAYGGSTVVPEATETANPNNNWQSTASDSPRTGCLTQVDACGKVPEFVIWIEGEQAAHYAAINPSFDMNTAWKTRFHQLRTDFLTEWGVTPAQCTWIVTPVGKINYGDTRYVLQSQLAYVNAGHAGVKPGPARYHLATYDGVHLDGAPCRTYGDMLAQQLLALLGVGAFYNCGPGPQLTSAWKGGTTVAMATNSTTGIVALPGTSYLTGFRVWDYGYSREFAVAGAWVSAGLIFLSLSDNPGDGNHVHIAYQLNNWADPSSPSFDQQGVFLARGNPLLPCSGIETSN